jgi:RNA polymerase sigma-70 factor (ECF subfamily)
MEKREVIDLAIAEVARGRTEAFGQIVREYALPLRSYLASQVHYLDDVDDLAQEVFLAALSRIDTFRREDDFGAWLRGIARNKLLTYYRTQSRRSAALQKFRDAITQTVEADLERAAEMDKAESISRLLGCISKLPEKMRRVVRAGLEGTKPAELATQLSTTVGVIYNLHYKANQLLRDCLRKGVETWIPT